MLGNPGGHILRCAAAARAGFVRLAIQQRAALVPVLAMGELDTLRNLIDMPRLQARCPGAQNCFPGVSTRECRVGHCLQTQQNLCKSV